MSVNLRFQQEWARLFAAPSDPPGQTRALVLELARPADWEAVAQLAQGVQTDLGLPAPALAVNGLDGYQLWFATAEPVPWAEAESWLRALWSQYWPQVDARRVRLWPARAGESGAAPLPTVPEPTAADQWSAFIAPDLGAVFADTPWLDTPPQPTTQADLLARVQPMRREDLQATLRRLLANDPVAPATAWGTVDGGAHTPPTAATGDAASRPTPPAQNPDAGSAQARAFLLQVMHDPTTPLRWRIAAAQALLTPGR